MPNIYSGTNDGYVHTASTSSWAFARDATTGTADSNDSQLQYAVRARKVASGRGTQWVVSRTFFEFDTSGISDAPSSANLQIFGRAAGNTADLFVVKSTQSTTLANTDFDAITGWVAGADNSSNVTKYSSEITSWTTSGYNTIALNSTALSDIVSLSTFKVCLIEADYDLPNTEPSTGTDVYSGTFFSDNSGTSNDPYLDYTVAVAADNSTFFGANF